MALEWNDIKDEFVRRVNTDKRAVKLMNTINSGRGTYQTASEFSVRVGDILGGILRQNAPLEDISEWDVDNLIPAALGMDHRMVSNACASVQRRMNADANLGIRAQIPKFDGDRAYGIVAELKANPLFVNIEKTFYDQITNFSQSVVDQAIRDNAEVQSNAGIKSYIVRVAEGGACPYCLELAGTYDYLEVKRTGHPVWSRHENCRCTIDYVTESSTERVNNYRRR